MNCASSEKTVETISSSPKGRLLASGSLWRTVNLAAATLSSLLVTPFVVHTMGDHNYGLWALVGTFIGYFNLMEMGLSIATTRHMATALGAGDDEQCNRVFNTALRLYSIIGLVALVVTIVLAVLLPTLFAHGADISVVRQLILIVGAQTALLFPQRVLSGALEARLHYNVTAGLDLLTTVLRAILMVVVVKAGIGLVGLAWAVVLAGAPSAVALVLYLRHQMPFLRLAQGYWQSSSVKELLSYSLWAFLSQIADMLRFRIDVLVVSAFISVSAVTHYNIAAQLIQYYISFVAGVFVVLQPLFSQQHGRGDHDRLQQTFFFSTKLSMCLSTFVGFGLLAWGKPFITRWMGAQYTDAYVPLVLMTVGCMVALWQVPSGGVLYGVAKHRWYALFNSGEAIANLVLSLIFVRKYGMMGVALGTLVPMAFVKIFIQPIYVCHVCNFAYGEYVRRVGRTLLSLILALVLPLSITSVFGAPNYAALATVGILSAVAYLIVFSMIELSSRERSVLRRALIPRFAIHSS